MTRLESQVRKARLRLAANQWLNQLCLTVSLSAGIFAALVLLTRLFDWHWPLGMIAAGLGAAALVTSIIWAVATRVDLATAAASLDDAAGTKERISSGLYCLDLEDPFARAVAADAERTGANLTVSRHLRWSVPSRLPTTSVLIVIAAAMLFLPTGLLAGEEEEGQQRAQAVERTTALIKERSKQIKSVARTNPELKVLAEELDKLGEPPGDRKAKPGELRQAALRKLDKMQDVLKQQQESDKVKSADEFKKMLRGIKPPSRTDTPANRLAKALSSGDFKAARQEIDKMREQLAKLGSPEDAAKLDQMQRQLDQLAKQIEQLSDDKQLSQKLQQAGMKKEDVERMLRQLTKKDLEQVRKQLQEQGMSQTEIDKLTKQLQKQAGANALAKQLGQALKQAGESAAAGAAGDASDQLAQAANQLSSLEMLEQEMEQIESTLADLQSAMNDLGNACPNCGGGG